MLRLLSFDDLKAQPEPDFLVDGLVPARSLGMLYGPSGVGKSFLALDLAHHVANGTPWLGRNTRQGAGLYIVAEGMTGFARRAVAWCAAKGLRSPGPMRYIPEAVRLGETAAVDELVALLNRESFSPALIVVDTLHASIPGGDENDAKDMGYVIAGCRRLQAAFDCAVLLIHHTGWDPKHERGSSATRAAMDVVLALRPQSGGHLELRTEKMRDAPPLAPIAMRLGTVGDSALPELVASAVQRLAESQRALLTPLRDGVPRKNGDWLQAAGVPHTTFYRARRDLLETHHAVEQEGKRFRITEAGRALLRTLDAVPSATALPGTAAAPSATGATTGHL